jgi:hypothetical protein
LRYRRAHIADDRRYATRLLRLLPFVLVPTLRSFFYDIFLRGVGASFYGMIPGHRHGQNGAWLGICILGVTPEHSAHWDCGMKWGERASPSRALI